MINYQCTECFMIHKGELAASNCHDVDVVAKEYQFDIREIHDEVIGGDPRDKEPDLVQLLENKARGLGHWDN